MNTLLHVLELRPNVSLSFNDKMFVRTINIMPYDSIDDVVLDIDEFDLQFTANDLERAVYDDERHEWKVHTEDGVYYILEIYELYKIKWLGGR